MEVTKAEFARMSNVSRAAITSKIKNGTLVENRAGRLDTDNPVNRAYLDKKQDKTQMSQTFNAAIQSAAVPSGSSPKKNVTASKEPDTPQQLLDMTMREIVQHYGSMDGIERYVKVLRDMTSADEKMQRLQEKRQMLISRDFVIVRLFGFINQLSNKVLDVPESLADQVIAMVLSDKDNCRQKIVTYTRDVLSRAIGGSKQYIVSELNSLKAKYDDSDELTAKIDELYEQQMEHV